MKYMSDQNRTCFQYESGTYAATTGDRQWIGLVQEHSLEPNMNVMQIRYQGSTDRNVDDFADGNQEWEGTISYYPQDWKFLGFAIGSITETVAAGSHLFTETNSDDEVQTIPASLTSFTIEDSKNIGHAGSNFIRTTVGGMVDSYELKAAQGEITSCEIGYKAQTSTLTSGAVTTLAPTTTKPYVFNNMQLHIPSGTIISNAKEFTFSVNNNLEPGFYLNGSRVINEFMPMNREYEFSATCDMDTSNAKTLYESYYVAGSEFNAYVNSMATAGSLALYMSGCKMTEMTIPSAVEGVQEQSFTFVPSHVNGIAYDSIEDYNAW
jgi:hypothetical protein